jgi:S1-C subfamily serine protease
MRRTALYSRSNRPRTDVGARAAGPGPAGAATPAADPATPDSGAPAASVAPGWRARLRKRLDRHERPLLFFAGALFAGVLLLAGRASMQVPRELTQDDIDAAVIRTFETKPLPSRAAIAYETVRPSVVAVRGFVPDPKGKDKDPDKNLVEQSVGTGVVIVDKGIILTNLHVVAGAKKVMVTFADGLESEASVIGVQAQDDLAVLRAHTIPDDLTAATMGTTQGLEAGHEVVAVGFPFGIGPSVSAGVVSGLRREYRSPEGKRILTNLIQFDAAANPGNSGGPLVTMEGHVVGIVTAILNPTKEKFFVGIGFAVPIENAAGAAGLPPF